MIRRRLNSNGNLAPPPLVAVAAAHPRVAARSPERRDTQQSTDWVRPAPRQANQPRRGKGRPPKHPTPALFYGYPAELIAQWCEVKLSTAYAYKSGRLKPGSSVVKLFELHAERRVLSSEWKGWLVKSDALVDPEGNETHRNLLRVIRAANRKARKKPSGRVSISQ